MLTPESKIRVETIALEVLRIAERFAYRVRYLGSDLDEATSSTWKYFCDHPHSNHPPEAIFRVCLRQALSKRLRPLPPTSNLPE